MKIKRFVAPNMKTAIAAVKKEIGEDAVILSNKSVPEGVELIAAVEFDEERFQAEVEKKSAIRNKSHSQSPVSSERKTKQSVASVETRSTNNDDRMSHAAKNHQASGYQAKVETLQDSSEAQNETMDAMRREMQALRRMMENELSGISWREMGHHRPESRELFRQLMSMGLSSTIAERLMKASASVGGFEQQWKKALYYLSAELSVTGDDLAERGGITAVVGPTGVGKTTSIAKLAARYCMKHGNRHVAMISTDNYRIGAREQLHTYGRILNVPVRTASNAEELMETLNAFIDKRFILIDTAGMSHQDEKLIQQLDLLEGAGRPITRYLALSATTDISALRRAVTTFAPIQPDACLVTKTDEAASLGAVLSVLIESQLPVAYYTDGQKVPEDMHVAYANPLVNLASDLAEETSEQLGDGFLAMALSEARSNVYL
ncbi:MAG: flagellar biosynthesis protein FlhF [Gammaproteobacteria bacterium]